MDPKEVIHCHYRPQSELCVLSRAYEEYRRCVGGLTETRSTTNKDAEHNVNHESRWRTVRTIKAFKCAPFEFRRTRLKEHATYTNLHLERSMCGVRQRTTC